MTEKYDPYENAIVERVNGILKQEFGVAKNILDFDLKNEFIRDTIKIYKEKDLIYLTTCFYQHKCINKIN
jgi:hypothetical protein